MNNGNHTLIHLDGVTKVFLTDEVETHALSGIHLDIRTGEYVSIAGPSGCGKSTLLSILGLLDTPSDGSYSLKGGEVANLSFPGARPDSQSRDRVHLPKLQPHRRPDGLRERRAAPDLSRDGRERAQDFRQRSARTRRDGASRETFARASSPAASNSASRSRARSPANRPSSWPTSRPATSTRATAKR